MRSPYSQLPDDKHSRLAVIKSKFPWCKIIILLLVGWTIYSGVRDKNTPVINDDVIDYIDDDEQEEEEEEPNVIKVDIKGSYLIRVYETEADQQKPWMVKVLDTDSFWIDWLNSKGMCYYTFDVNSNREQAKSFIEAAEQHSLDPPFILHGKDGVMLSVIAFDKDATVANIKETVLSKSE